jgi:hypothetical protein
MLPLNLDHNQHSPFAKTLSTYRSAARTNARSLPTVANDWMP